MHTGEDGRHSVLGSPALYTRRQSVVTSAVLPLPFSYSRYIADSCSKDALAPAHAQRLLILITIRHKQ